jgi:hypothetical protein
LEAAVAAAAVAVIAARVRAITADLTDAFQWVVAAPGRWATARFYAAARLRAVPVRLAETVGPQLVRAASLGAKQVGVPLPAGYDPTVRPQVRAVLDRVDETVRQRLRDTARTVTDDRIDTPAQLAQVVARVEAVPVTARARVEDVVARTVGDGAHAAVYGARAGGGVGVGRAGGGEPAEPEVKARRVADVARPKPKPAPEPKPKAEPKAKPEPKAEPAPKPKAEPAPKEPEPTPEAKPEEPAKPEKPPLPALDLVWWSERRACIACESIAGALPDQDGLYRPILQVPRPDPYITEGVIPPAHPSCRCRLVPATPGLADALRREAQREVAYGWSAYDSLRSRLGATDLLLRGGASRLPKTVVERARKAVDNGEFTQPPPPR